MKNSIFFLNLALILITKINLYSAAYLQEEQEKEEETRYIVMYESQINQFMDAAEKGNISEVEKWIKAGININIPSRWQRRALVEAANNKHHDVVKLLIDNGAKVDVADANGYTALKRAMKHDVGYDIIVQLLIRSGANVNTTNLDGDTVLMWAADQGYKDTVRLMLSLKANVNAANKDGETALMYAARDGDAILAKLLLTAGADLNMKNKRGRKAIDIANRMSHIRKCKLEVVKLLEDEPARRESKIKKRNEAIFMLTNAQLLPALSNIVAGYVIESYEEIPDIERN